MDYLFWTSLLSSSFFLLVVSYDIACMWSINLFSRLSKGLDRGSYGPAYSPLLQTVIRYFVPNFHLHAHGPKCHTRYSFNLNRRVGLTHGETVEQEWAHIGAVATSTREMGPGARHGTLDAHWSHWNWRKLVGLGKPLRTMY
jgi:hypothetical protein